MNEISLEPTVLLRQISLLV